MDQSRAVMLRQLCYGKISFIELVPEDGKSMFWRSTSAYNVFQSSLSSLFSALNDDL